MPAGTIGSLPNPHPETGPKGLFRFNYVHSSFAPGESADKYGLNVFGVRAQFDF